MRTNKGILTYLFVFTLNLASAQSFEGILTYSVNYKFDSSLHDLKDEVIQQMKDDGEYYDSVKIFIKQNRYLKQENRIKPTSIIYDPIQNEIIALVHSEKTALIQSGTRFNLLPIPKSKPTFLEVDTVKIVNGIPSSALLLSWDYGEEWYFYNNEEVSITPGIFKYHNYEYLNKILDFTGSYPLEIVRQTPEAITVIISIVKIEAVALPDEVFDIPDLKPMKNRYAKESYEEYGIRLMKIKN